MQASGDHFEVVLVTKRCALLDANFLERAYWRRDGVPLAVGYYLVSWPAEIEKRMFNEDATFRGPFKTHDDARAALRSFVPRPSSEPRLSALTTTRRFP